MEVLEPPSFQELLESGARALFSPGDVFTGLAARPEPLPAEAALALLGWGAVSAGILLAYAMTRLNAGSWGVLPLAAGGLGALILSAPAGFAAAGLIHALSSLSGGTRGFWRSVEAAAVLGAVPALLLAALWAPDPAWLALPTLYATWLAVAAVEKLHDAPSGQAWMVVGCCGALLAGAQVAGHDKVMLALVRMENAATVLSNNPAAAAEESRRAAALAAPLAAPGRQTPADRLDGRTGSAGPIESDPTAPAGAAARSSLDYLSAPSEESSDEDPRPAPDPMAMQAQSMQSAGSNLIKNLRSQLERNPDAMAGMPPGQAEGIRRLLAQFENNMKSGKGGPMMSPQETQKLLQQVMGAMGGKTPAAGQPAPPGKKRRRAPPPPSDE